MMRLMILVAFFAMGNVSAKTVVHEVQGKQYEAFLLNKGKNAPTVFIIHDWDGLTDYEKKRARMLAKLGYSVFAVDLFGKGIRPKKVEDRRQHTGELYKNRKKMRAILRGALNFAKKQGLNTRNAVAMGYCFGGAAVLEWARAGENLKGFVTFHGGLSTPGGQDYKKVRGSVLVFHGTSDAAIPMSQFSELAAQLDAHKISHEMITYGGAPHAFTVYGNPRYRKKADEASWRRFKEFLKRTLG